MQNEDEKDSVAIPIQIYGEKEEDEQASDDPLLEETTVQRIARAALIMRDGTEIQRISIVRNIPALMNDDADECLIKLIPMVQDVLRCTAGGGVGLELHLASSEAYKEVILIQHQRLQREDQAVSEADRENNNAATNPPVTIDLGLCSQILKSIVQNVESHESIASSAWLDALLDVVDHLPLCLTRSRVLPLASNKAQQLNCVQARLTAAKLFGRLARKLDANEVKNELVPLVQALCQDSNALVRVSMCQQLPLVSQCLQEAELNSVVLPLIIEFSKDEDESVREANLEAIASLIDAFDDDTCVRVLVPLVSKFIEDTLSENGEGDAGDAHRRTSSCTRRSVLALAKNYGLLCTSLNKHLDNKKKMWLIERFCELASLGADTDDRLDDDGDFGHSSRMDFSINKHDSQIALACRRYAAFSFPAVIRLASESSSDAVKRLLLPQFKQLCHDTETEVRVRIAAGFHQLARHLGDDAACLIDSFVALVYSGDPEVIGGLTSSLDETLHCIYGANMDTNGNVLRQDSPAYTQLTRILLACNRLIRNGGNWRSHQQLLSALACLSRFISNDELSQSFLPMIKEEIVNARAVPCRLAALETLVQWTRDMRRNGNVSSVVSYCLQTLANNRSCHKRCLFLDACRMFIEADSPDFFHDHFFDAAMRMVDDPVVNIRLKFCQLLPMLKKSLPADSNGEQLTKLDTAVKTLLTTDNQGYIGEIVKKAINELARADASENGSPKTAGAEPDESKPPIKKRAQVAPMPTGDADVQPPSEKEEPAATTLDEAKSEGVVSSGPSRASSSSPFIASGRSVFPSTTAAGKKTAIVQPRQVVARSPSPRPPFNQRDASTSDTVKSRPSALRYGSSRSTQSSTDACGRSATRSSDSSKPPTPSKDSAASIRASSSARRTSASQVRGIQSGTVSRSIQRFEATSTGSAARADKEGPLSRRYSSTSRGLDYSRTLNRSFSSFGRNSSLSYSDSRDTADRASSIAALDSRKDYLYSSPLRRSSYSTSRLSSADRSLYSLTRVRSGSCLSGSSNS